MNQSTAGGTLIVEIRAYLEPMSLDGFDATVTADDEMIQDSVEEETPQFPDLNQNLQSLKHLPLKSRLPRFCLLRKNRFHNSW